jgi:hypothetical protein
MRATGAEEPVLTRLPPAAGRTGRRSITEAKDERVRVGERGRAMNCGLERRIEEGADVLDFFLKPYARRHTNLYSYRSKEEYKQYWVQIQEQD